MSRWHLATCLVAFGLLTAAYVQLMNERSATFTDAVYYTAFGGMYCGRMEYTRCGLHLWECTDEREYVCLTNVAVKK